MESSFATNSGPDNPQLQQQNNGIGALLRNRGSDKVTSMSVQQTMDAEQPSPGAVIEIRDETWLVVRSEAATDGWFVDVEGLSELVRGTQATFYNRLDQITVLDPANATVRLDDSPKFMKSRLWLESTLRKTPIPMLEPSLSVAGRGLVDPLPYQLDACRQALDPKNLRPRILLADAVGLGKTIEIGMILSELVRRGRGERILIVSPRHVLEQMQFELWTRFALPFVRLDSVGIQRVRNQLPATRNPFSYFKRPIVSIDTLKSDHYYAHLSKQHWDAVVIDESHNVTNSSALNNRLARLLSSRTDALILASATPHNGKKESFAELIRMLEPTAVSPDGELIEAEVKRLVKRRHRHHPEVAQYVGAEWAERMPLNNILVKASPAEDAIARELEEVWLHPSQGESPVSSGARLFPWTLAKAYLSSSAALLSTIKERKKKVEPGPERDALDDLKRLAEDGLKGTSAKYGALREELARIGISPRKPNRVVIFAERVDTLQWLHDNLGSDLKLKPGEQIRILHGGISDVEQQEIVEAFKLESSPIRVLVTGDVASEGVNLHVQCNELIHYDIPWSLIRIEQRNGRIDRYGQKERPQITTLLLNPSTDRFSGDIRVLQRLMEKENEAHRALGDSASLMGQYDVKAEESAIRDVLAGKSALDDVVREIDEIKQGDDIDGMLARLFSGDKPDEQPEEVAPSQASVYGDDPAFLKDALVQAFGTPEKSLDAGGVSWKEEPDHSIVSLAPPKDLRRRLEVLPQSYLRDRKVAAELRLATSAHRGKAALKDAHEDESSTLWPSAHFLAPLHPALDWAADRALASLSRNEVFAVYSPAVDVPSMLVQGTLTNKRGQVVALTYVIVTFPKGDPDFAMPQPVTISEAIESLGLNKPLANTGVQADTEELGRFVAPAVEQARVVVDNVMPESEARVKSLVSGWVERSTGWDERAFELVQRHEIAQRRKAVADEKQIAEQMLPEQRHLRPLLLVLPSHEGGDK